MSRIPIVKHPMMHFKKKWYRYRYKHGKTPTSTVEKGLNAVRFVFDFSLGRHTKKQYHGLYELEVVEAMKKFLYPGAIFLDIGANIGYLSAIGASLVGEKGVVHSFEPVPAYFERLLNLAKLNPDYNIVANNFALGESNGSATIDISGKSHIGLNSMILGFVSKTRRVESTLNVPVRRLDSYITQSNLSDIALIKIDVEGYELPVLKGASGFFEENKNNLPPIIVEVVPSVYKQLNSSVCALEEFMLTYGYKAYCIFGRHRFDLRRIQQPEDVVFKAEAP